jgi:hypothetical protein
MWKLILSLIGLFLGACAGLYGTAWVLWYGWASPEYGSAHSAWGTGMEVFLIALLLGLPLGGLSGLVVGLIVGANLDKKRMDRQSR